MNHGEVMTGPEIVSAFMRGETLQGLSPAAEQVIRDEITALRTILIDVQRVFERTSETLRADAYEQMGGYESERWSRFYSTGYAQGKVEAVLAFDHACNLVSVLSLQREAAASPGEVESGD